MDARWAQAEELTERLRHRPPAEASPAEAGPPVVVAPLAKVAPAEVAPVEVAPAPTAPAPAAGVWTLKRLQATFPWLAHYRSLSGVWRAVRRLHQRLRRGRPRQFSPDPNYLVKEAQLLDVLRRVGERQPRNVASRKALTKFGRVSVSLRVVKKLSP